MIRTAWLALLLAVATGACAPTVRRFPLRAPLWQDPDRNALRHPPKARDSTLYADAMDWGLLARPVEATAVRLPREAANVNALDEVPDSSWFQNRIGLFPMTPAQLAQGPCTGPPLDPARGPLFVTKAKHEGVTPGFFIRDPDGVRYLLKTDDVAGPQRGTAAEAIVSRIFWAAGYNAPCNDVVYVAPAVLRFAPGATSEDARGIRHPLTPRDVDRVLEHALRMPDGRYRFVASRFLPGKAIGPFAWSGVRRDDPNDVVPHEDRREVRALRLLAAWVSHFDIRGQNSLDMVETEGGRTFVRHNQLDFGDSFGAPWLDERLARRAGLSYFFDIAQALEDLVTLGVIARPWWRVAIDPDGAIFNFYGVREFRASRWRPIYPNPAFDRMTRRDALWMARIIARFSDAHLRALVRTGQLTDPRAEAYLLRVLAARRDLLVREYLGGQSPLDRVQVVGGPHEQSLCFEDLAIAAAGVPPETVAYRARMVAGRRLDRPLWDVIFHPDPRQPARRCLPLPGGRDRPSDLAPAGAPDDDPGRYAVVYAGHLRGPDLAVHLYDLGPGRGFVLVGLERVQHGSVPEQ
jgi:hypothetical protein